MKRSARLVLLCLSVLLSSCTQWFFFPQPGHVQTPTDIGYEYEDLFFPSTDGVRIHAWLVEPLLKEGEAVKGTAYFLHGNAQNISWHIAGAQWLLANGYRVFALDYRGYGLSTGQPNIPEVYDDISAGFAWLKSDDAIDRNIRMDEEPIILFGQSLGASLSVNWLGQHPEAQEQIGQLVIESGFARL